MNIHIDDDRDLTYEQREKFEAIMQHVARILILLDSPKALSLEVKDSTQ